METQPLIVIVGPTASGKTSLAIELAEKYEGEIICADSRTIYKGMDVGTAKPTAEERRRVPHWGLDLVKPNESFSAAEFKRYATQKIQEIRERGRTPFLVGGTGLYIDAVVFDYQFGSRPDLQYRSELEDWSLDQLHEYCVYNNINLPENKQNKRYLIRAIEQKGINDKRRKMPIDNSIIVGIATDKQVLRERIERRSEQLFKDGVVKEAIILGKMYGWDSQAMTGNIYPILRLYLNNRITLKDAKDKFTTSDWRLAKRQLTWLRRNNYIKWLPLSEANTYIQSVLANE